MKNPICVPQPKGPNCQEVECLEDPNAGSWTRGRQRRKIINFISNKLKQSKGMKSKKL